MDKNTVKGWMTKANHDLEVTKLDKILPSDIVCYHAQQAAEKYLKAFLIANDADIKLEKFHIHDIDRLLVKCALIDPEFEKLSNMGIGKLTEYAVNIRYPGDYDMAEDLIMPSFIETKEAISLAEKTVAFVKERLNIKYSLSQNPQNKPEIKSEIKRRFGR